jgi:hypothetical protein
VLERSVVRALDANGAVVWQKQFGTDVIPNWRGNAFVDLQYDPELETPLVLTGAHPGEEVVVIATRAAHGAPELWSLGAGGRVEWRRPLRWTPPAETHTGGLRVVFEMPFAWSTDRHGVVVNVRDGDWSSTGIQFYSAEGESLGAYYHPGHLEYFSTGDLDGDGRGELLLTGMSNAASGDWRFLPPPATRGCYIDCVVMLEAGHLSGQAFPYRTWDGLPAAAEEGYLLLPPLRAGLRPKIAHLAFGDAGAATGGRIELTVDDGRIYTLDTHLRPLSCTVGDSTLAARLAPTRATGPLLYIRYGAIERIDLPVGRLPG